MAKKFKHWKVWKIENLCDTNKSFFCFSNIFKYFLIFACVFCVIFLWKYIIKSWQVALWFLGKSTVQTVSNSFWKEMIRDPFGNVNIMLIWVWWDDHHGGYLADSMIVASWNPELWAMTMISIPRDLYIASTGFAGRINWLFARGYNQWWQNIWSGAQNLIKKTEEVLWLTIPYYLVADFQWFKEVVDTIWGIEVYVPNTIHDIYYPDEWLWYETFHISAWNHILDWDTALKYARSRHTTSDFARSQRQQEILKAAIDKILQKQNITNIWTLKELYSTYTRMVTTNISLKEIIGMFQYSYNFKHLFSFGLNTYCNYRSYTITDAGCFLYNGNRDAYGGMAVMVPIWARPNNISFYEYINRFVFFAAHNQYYLIENPRIIVKNGIDKNYATQKKQSPTGRASKMAVKLKKYGFNLAWVDNHPENLEQTTVIAYWKTFAKTIEALQFFMPINVVKEWQIWSWEELAYDLEIILWNDFIDHLTQTPFNFER